MLFNLFKATDKKIFKKLGGIAHIRNGVGYGFISDKELYHNGHIEIGIGRSTSGRGDWGGGFDYATTSPIKITIDKNYKIIKAETDSFYNSKSSKQIERVAKTFIGRLGKTFTVKDELLRECIDTIFSVIPCKKHIGLDVNLDQSSHTRHMLNYFMKVTSDYNFEDSKMLNVGTSSQIEKQMCGKAKK